MTLIVAVMTPVQVILVSDRRFSGSGKPDEDERNKVAVFMCNNGRAAIAFTGMAAFAKFKTTEMLLDAFSRAAAPDHLFLPTIGRVAGVLTEEVKKLKIPADKKHLTVIVAGYEYRLPEGAKTVLFKITNSGEHKSALDTFSIQRRRDTREDIGVFGVFSFGRTEGVLRQDGAVLRDLVLKGAPTSAIVDKTVDAIRNAAKSPKSQKQVGSQCNSIVLPSDTRKAVTADYHSMTASNTLYMPNAVISTTQASFTSDDTYIEQRGVNTPIVLPKVGRNVPCPCGSGKKYKKCCRRTQKLIASALP